MIDVPEMPLLKAEQRQRRCTCCVTLRLILLVEAKTVLHLQRNDSMHCELQPNIAEPHLEGDDVGCQAASHTACILGGCYPSIATVFCAALCWQTGQEQKLDTAAYLYTVAER